MEWEAFYRAYNFTPRREALFDGLRKALLHFKSAGCARVFIDGSFVTQKAEPGDYDACWDTQNVDFSKVDRMFLDGLQFGTMQQKLVYSGEFYPANFMEGRTHIPFLDFFQTDKASGKRKGIIEIKLEGVK